MVGIGAGPGQAEAGAEEERGAVKLFSLLSVSFLGLLPYASKSTLSEWPSEPVQASATTKLAWTGVTMTSGRKGEVSLKSPFVAVMQPIRAGFDVEMVQWIGAGPGQHRLIAGAVERGAIDAGVG